MSEKPSEDLDKSYENRLYPEDQEKVDEFVSRGINSVERKPFRPLRLILAHSIANFPACTCSSRRRPLMLSAANRAT